ncbi:UvrD-helicase domain-containing protein, partial [Neisseria sicca]|uniref:UvrD-helicase domain-containing protein n=1 Tax=Neisseria sicca TaxID=490 RepID=UPI001649F3E9
MIHSYPQYHKISQPQPLLHFPHLILPTYQILQTNQILPQHYQNPFNHILLHHFQHTNNLQYPSL